MSGKETATAWDLSETQRLIDHSAVRLLRSQNAALTLTFLHRAFKEHQAISVPESHLRARLENFLSEAREYRPGAYEQTAAEYLAAWCGTEQLLLKKLYSEEAEEPVFELTTAAERAMQWLEDLQTRPFVGAESRLELIFRQLEEIDLFSTPDAERRVTALRAQQATVQAQIESIEATNTAEAYTAVQLTERFANALDLARGLESAATGEDRCLRDHIREIQQLALACRNSPPLDDHFWELAGPPEIFASFSRALWQPDATGQVTGSLTFAGGMVDWRVVERFRALTDLNLATLREHVRTCLIADDSVLLSHLLRRFPPREGILEVVGYILVAMQDSQHYVADDQLVDIQIATTNRGKELWRVPEVLFTRTQ